MPAWPPGQQRAKKELLRFGGAFDEDTKQLTAPRGRMLVNVEWLRELVMEDE
jgi:hypothetical protein